MGGYPAGWAGSCSPSMTTATAVPRRTSSKTSLGGEPNAMPTSLRCQDQPLDALAGYQVTFCRRRMADLAYSQRTRRNNSSRPMAITLNRRKPSWGDFSSGMLPKFMPLIAEQKRQQHDDDRGNGQHLHDLVDVAGIEADVAVDRRHGIAVARDRFRCCSAMSSYEVWCAGIETPKRWGYRFRVAAGLN